MLELIFSREWGLLIVQILSTKEGVEVRSIFVSAWRRNSPYLRVEMVFEVDDYFIRIYI